MENKEIVRAEEAEGMGEGEEKKEEGKEKEGEEPENCATCGGCA